MLFQQKYVRQKRKGIMKYNINSRTSSSMQQRTKTYFATLIEGDHKGRPYRFVFFGPAKKMNNVVSTEIGQTETKRYYEMHYKFKN
ncbi:MAG: hypothetical protein CFE24_10745 [Flavobacterium sp. BFFFF2]|nr:MAG: hypothetical protein CFE24_10745 [Flavobacterium sp. BFFFF2]